MSSRLNPESAEVETASTHGPLIFISIAAYRDPQLGPTVVDCLHKATHPDRLRFGICWQHGPEEQDLPFLADFRFRVIDADWRQSRGACWARAEIMKLWQGESWFLQVDSHCRFVAGWDEILVRTSAKTGSQKPILSTYASPFTPGDDEVLLEAPMQMELQSFSAEGIPQLMPANIPWRQADLISGHRPRRARFLAAGFLFAPGSFVTEVPYDPEIYFLGEESSMTVRAFTHGYDLFHPSQTIVWHDYIRADARKHWGDHTPASSAPKPWNELDLASRKKVRNLLLGKPVGTYGLGSTRSLADYEVYAGISFRLRKAHPYTIRAAEPPNPNPPTDWPGEMYAWIVRIRFRRADLADEALRDPAAWRITFRNAQDIEIDRRNLPPQELSMIAGDEEEIAIICEFFAGTIPTSWTIQPIHKDRGALASVSGTLLEGDYAILDANDEQ